MSKILVIGASGTVGQTLVELLRGKGHEVVRGTSRRSLEPDQVHLDLATGEGVGPAIHRATRAFVMSPPGFADQSQLLAPVIEAAKQQKLEKVVLMSAMGADADPSFPLRKAELQLEESGVPFAIIRPNWFMQNFNSYWLAGIRQQGEILLPVGEAKGSFVDARDIAAVAVELLSSDRNANKAFNLTGPEALDHHEVARILSQASGNVIRYREISEEEMRAILLGGGLPTGYTEYLLAILAHFKAGHAARVTESIAQIVGRAPLSFEEYARDYSSAWAERAVSVEGPS